MINAGSNRATNLSFWTFFFLSALALCLSSCVKDPLPEPETQLPYQGLPWQIPGRIEAEHFDRGGEGLAYHDLSADNLGACLRPREAVDIEAGAESGSGYAVYSIEAGEWLEYTVEVLARGLYAFDFKVASLAERQIISIEIDDQAVSGIIVGPDSGGWDNWIDIRRAGVLLESGIHVLRIRFGSDLVKLDCVEVSSYEGAPEPAPCLAPFSGSPILLPGRVEAEDFDSGGWTIAYHDTRMGNDFGQYRLSEDVDIDDEDSGYVISNFQEGEWLLYSIQATVAGWYDIRLRYATQPWFGGRSLGFSFKKAEQGNFLPISNAFYLPNSTEGYGECEFDSIYLEAGIAYHFRLASVNGFSRINYLEFNLDDDDDPGPPVPETQAPFIDGSGLSRASADVSALARIQAEYFDYGGEQTAYYDVSPGQQYGMDAFRGMTTDGRIIDVDIAPTDDADGNYHIDSINTGEWLEYSLYLPSAGLYDLRFRYYAGSSDYYGESPFIQLALDGTPRPAAVFLCAGNGAWKTALLRCVDLPPGDHVLRLTLGTNGWTTRLNWFEVSPNAFGLGGTSLPALGRAFLNGTLIAAHPILASGAVRIQSEDFDFGPAAPSEPQTARSDYASFVNFDWTGGNEDGYYRQENPDVEVCGDLGGGFHLSRSANEEWQVYTIEIAQAGSYVLRARYSTANAGNQWAYPFDLGVSVVGSPAAEVRLQAERTTTDPALQHSSWLTSQESPSFRLEAGTQRLRLRVYSHASFNFNWFELERIGE